MNYFQLFQSGGEIVHLVSLGGDSSLGPKSAHKNQISRKYAKKTVKRQNLLGWLGRLTIENKTFHSVEDPMTLKSTKLTPISRNTPLSKMSKVTEMVETNIVGTLHLQFAIIVDDRSHSSKNTRFIGIFARYPDSQDQDSAFTSVLAISLYLGELTLNADVSTKVHSVYERHSTCILSMIGDYDL